jgi:1-acyl-sn-glycerol-3-phosphate acyltransferase
MKYIISLYSWIVGGIVFGSILVFAIIVTFLIPPHIYDPWLKKMLRIIPKILRTKVQVEGQDKIDRNGYYLFMANHVSIFDLVLLGGYIPVYFRGVEADRQHKWPLYGWAVKRIGNISIERENIHGSIRSMNKAKDHLQEGKSIAIMPEGHRTLDGNLRAFKKLPFFLAKEAHVDIVPIGLSGLFDWKRKGSWHIRPTTVKIKFGEIITSEEIKEMSVVDLRDKTRERIQGLIERP